MLALDGELRRPLPCLMQVQGGKDLDSWKAFFATLGGSPEWVVSDLDPAIGRAVRETWPGALLIPSRHHLAELMRERARADGIAERVELSEPIALHRPVAWSPGRISRGYGEHPLFSAIGAAQRGRDEWQRLKVLIEEHVPTDRLALRSWIATHQPLVERGWRLAECYPDLPLSTGGLEGRLDEWLAPLRRRAGRWQNARRLNLVLGLITLRARGEAHEARYTALLRARFAAADERAHLPTTDDAGRSWWRTWHDHAGESLPRLVFDAEQRARQRAADDHLERLRQRLAQIYAAEHDLRRQ